MDLSKLVEALLSEMKQIASSQTVVGEPIRVGESTVIPVNKLSLGFGVGTGRADRNGHAAPPASALGGGLTVQPQAFIVVDAAGAARLLSLGAASGDSAMIRAIELLPGVAEKLIEGGSRLLHGDDAEGAAPPLEPPAKPPKQLKRT